MVSRKNKFTVGGLIIAAYIISPIGEIIFASLFGITLPRETLILLTLIGLGVYLSQDGR